MNFSRFFITLFALTSSTVFANVLDCSFELKHASSSDLPLSRTSQIEVNGQLVGTGINTASLSLTHTRTNTIRYADKNILVSASASVFNDVEGTYRFRISAQKKAGATSIAFDAVVAKDRPVVVQLPLKNGVLPSRSADYIEVNCKLNN